MVKYTCERCGKRYDEAEKAIRCENSHNKYDKNLAPVHHIGQVAKIINCIDKDARFVIVGSVPDYEHEDNYSIPIVLYNNILKDGQKQFCFYERCDEPLTLEDDEDQEYLAITKSIHAIEYLLAFIDINALYFRKEQIEASRSDDSIKRKYYGCD